VGNTPSTHQTAPTHRFTKVDRLALILIASWFLSDAVFLLALLFLGPALFIPVLIGFFLTHFILLLLMAILYVKWSSAPTPSS
jgi:hypothetical protein